MRTKTYSVYKLTSPNGKVYIGCTSQNPKTRWDYGNKYHHNEDLSSDIKSFGWNNFNHDIIHAGLEEEDAYELERELIHKYNSYDPRYGYNKTHGGKTNPGMIRSDAYRKQISNRMAGEKHPFYGKHLPEETRLKISKANMWHKVSDETKHKIGEANRGRSKSEETIRKWRESISITRKVLCIDTGIVYDSISTAAKENNTTSNNIISVCKGRTKTACGYRWTYINNESEE